MSENGWQNENTSGNATDHSGIRYTYNPSDHTSPYNTNTHDAPPQKKRKIGNGCFIAVIAALLCVTIVAAGISLFSALTGPGTEQAISTSPTATAGATDDAQRSTDSAFDRVVEVIATPTPEPVEGQLLTAQQAAEKVIPSVVCIQCYVTNTYYGRTSTDSLYSEGSGIISRADGYIVTNAHVIEDATSVQVVLQNGMIRDAEIVGKDTITDLALLKIDPSGLTLTPATFSSADKCHVADTVLAIGNPGGLDFFSSVTQGIISALNRTIQDDTTGYVMHCIQTDTAINPGNSGGPLIDLYGNVIGITSSKIVAEGYENMGFAITYDEAAPILTDLMQYGRVRNRATINLTLALPSSVFRMSGWSSIPSGLCVTAVTGENETKAGLNQYDIIYAIDGKAINSMSDYSSYLLTKLPGDTVTLTVYRATFSGWSVSYATTPTEITLTLSEAK